MHGRRRKASSTTTTKKRKGPTSTPARRGAGPTFGRRGWTPSGGSLPSGERAEKAPGRARRGGMGSSSWRLGSERGRLARFFLFFSKKVKGSSPHKFENSRGRRASAHSLCSLSVSLSLSLWLDRATAAALEAEGSATSNQNEQRQRRRSSAPRSDSGDRGLCRCRVATLMRLFLLVRCVVFFVRPLGGDASRAIQSCCSAGAEGPRWSSGEEIDGELFDGDDD